MTGKGWSRHDTGLVIVSLIWAGNYSVSKAALVHISPVTFAAIRFVLSTTLLWLMVWGLKQFGPVSPATIWRTKLDRYCMSVINAERLTNSAPTITARFPTGKCS